MAGESPLNAVQKLIVDPHPMPRYTLAELLAQCDDSASRTDEDEVWLADGVVGREEI
jgi:antitoxin ChpS